MADKKDIIYRFAKMLRQMLGDRLTKVILYGSYARGDYNENSDIDIMVLTTFSDEEIEQVESRVFDLAFDFLMEYGIDISVIVKNDEHFYHWLGALPFYNNVDKEGIVIGESKGLFKLMMVDLFLSLYFLFGLRTN